MTGSTIDISLTRPRQKQWIDCSQTSTKDGNPEIYAGRRLPLVGEVSGSYAEGGLRLQHRYDWRVSPDMSARRSSCQEAAGTAPCVLTTRPYMHLTILRQVLDSGSATIDMGGQAVRTRHCPDPSARPVHRLARQPGADRRPDRQPIRPSIESNSRLSLPGKRLVPIPRRRESARREGYWRLDGVREYWTLSRPIVRISK